MNDMNLLINLLDTIYKSGTTKEASANFKKLTKKFNSMNNKEKVKDHLVQQISADAICENMKTLAKRGKYTDQQVNISIYPMTSSYISLAHHFLAVVGSKITVSEFQQQLQSICSFLDMVSDESKYPLINDDEIKQVLNFDLVKRILPILTTDRVLSIIRIDGYNKYLDGWHAPYTNTIILASPQNDNRLNVITTFLHEIGLALAHELSVSLDPKIKDTRDIVPRSFKNLFEQTFHNSRDNVKPVDFPVIFADCFVMAALWDTEYLNENGLYNHFDSHDSLAINRYFRENIFVEYRVRDKKKIILSEDKAPNIPIFLKSVDLHTRYCDCDDAELQDWEDCMMELDEEYEYLFKRWFEIITHNDKNEEVHAGYITGYYIDIKKLRKDILYTDGSDSFFEFDGNSQITCDLWHYLSTSQKLKRLPGNLYLLNSITLEEKYCYTDIEITAIGLLQDTLKKLYDVDINSIIYTYGYTELDDDTIQDTTEEHWIRRKAKMLKNGFKEFIEDEETIYLYKKL